MSQHRPGYLTETPFLVLIWSVTAKTTWPTYKAQNPVSMCKTTRLLPCCTTYLASTVVTPQYKPLFLCPPGKFHPEHTYQLLFPCSFCPRPPIPCCDLIKDNDYGNIAGPCPSWTVQLKDISSKCEKAKTRTLQPHPEHYQPSSESEEDYDNRESPHSTSWSV